MRRTVQILSLLFLVLTARAAPGDAIAAEFETRFVSPLVAEAPGAALLVVDRGKVILRRTYGVRQAGSQLPITESTRFRLASVSKTFASTAAALLVRETRVDWHAPLETDLDYLRFKRNDFGSQISLHHLMSQSTGLMPHAYTNLVEDNMSYPRIIARLDKVDFICAPGDCYGYQNVVFSLVGDVVKARTGMTYDDYVAERLFKPLAMSRASIGLDAFVSDDNYARPHVWTGNRWAPVRPTPHYYRVAPAAGVNASITDMEQWLLAHMGRQPEILSPEVLDELHTGVIETSRQQAHYKRRRALGKVYYGLGFRVFEYGDQQYVHHGGYVKGMRSEMVFSRDQQLGMVFLTNSSPQGVSDLVFEFVDFYQEAATRDAMQASVGR